MSSGKIKVVTCQFAVSGSIRVNARRIQSFLHRARRAKADIVHLPECALSGYAGKDFETLDGLDWQLLKQETEQIMALAKKLRLWVVLGSVHRLTPPNKPHNSLYLIDPTGKIADRYDKRFCLTEELQHYTPGNRFVTFDINGVKCALLICFDVRFPEIYRALYKQNVNCILQSFYNARQKGPSVHTYIMRQTMQCRAATNHFWVSMANASGYYSPYPSCFIRPDGVIVRQLRQNQAGSMVNIVDLSKEFYDPMAPFRDMAVSGKLTNAPEGVEDPRSQNTTEL
ncbi:MAG TPA: carbon-nitrogen hydrolase family protein [Sedimentisphaerales bacterium]|nr:carbon-nitrogen hydrolase family protein [Sedimentisphaerales bacterium]